MQVNPGEQPPPAKPILEEPATEAGARGETDEDSSTLVIPDYEERMHDDLVTVEDLRNSWAARFPEYNKDPTTRPVYNRYYERLAQHLQRKDPGFRYQFWLNGSGVTLHRGQLNVFRDPVPAGPTGGRVDEILFRCDRMAVSAHEFIEGAQLRNCVNMLFDVSATCCDLLNAIHEAKTGKRADAPDEEVLQQTLRFLEAEVRRVDRYLRQAALRRAQVHYAKGMLLGAAGIYVTAAVTWVIVNLANLEEETPDVPLALGVIAAGCTGAVVSVMQRMTTGKLDIDYTMGPTVGTLGIFRPVIGAIFAVAASVLIRGGLIPYLETPTDESAPYFFLSLAFVTGFSERLAQDMLTTSEKALGGAGDGASDDQRATTAVGASVGGNETP